MKWKILGIVCAIGFFAYLFFIFCESVQDNGMSYTFSCRRISLVTYIFLSNSLNPLFIAVVFKLLLMFLSCF